MAEKITLNNGRAFEPAHAMEDGEQLQVFIRDGTRLTEAVEAFMDAEATARIQADWGPCEVLYEGFTEMADAWAEDVGVEDHQVIIILRRGEDHV